MMTSARLSGSLGSLHLLAIVRFLSDLHKSGQLSLSHERWQGTIDLEDGALVGATLGSEADAAAFEGIALALSDGKFAFRDEAVPHTRSDWRVAAAELPAYLAQLEAERNQVLRRLPSLRLVPVLAAEPPPLESSATVTIDADALALLPRLASRPTVEQLVDGRGLARTVRHVVRLAELGLITLAPLASPAPTASAAPAATPKGRRLDRVARPLVGFFVRDPEPAAVRDPEPAASERPPVASAPRLAIAAQLARR